MKHYIIFKKVNMLDCEASIDPRLCKKGKLSISSIMKGWLHTLSQPWIATLRSMQILSSYNYHNVWRSQGTFMVQNFRSYCKPCQLKVTTTEYILLRRSTIRVQKTFWESNVGCHENSAILWHNVIVSRKLNPPHCTMVKDVPQAKTNSRYNLQLYNYIIRT